MVDLHTVDRKNNRVKKLKIVTSNFSYSIVARARAVKHLKSL